MIISSTIFENVSDDTIFTVVATLSIFLLGIAIDRLIKFLSKCFEKRNIRRNYFFRVYNIFEKQIPLLRDGYRTMYIDKDINSGFPMTPPVLLSNEMTRLLHYENERIFKSIRMKYWNSLSLIISRVDTVDCVKNESSRYHIRALKDNDNCREEIQICIEKYMNLLANYCEAVRNNVIPKSSIYNMISDSIPSYYQEIASKGDLKAFIHEILRPIQVTLVYSQQFRKYSIANDITAMGKFISHRYNYLYRLTTEMRAQYRTYYYLLDGSYNKIENELNKKYYKRIKKRINKKKSQLFKL